ncbi:MAG: hypothetical protein IH859_07775, partial [Chloroflexi bacterium]|nr:hypothetical protein [Chloroflexota bacterium]
TPKQHQHKLVRSFNNFEEYIQWRVEKDVRLKKEFVCDSAGNLIVDFVGRFENIQEAFNSVCNALKLKNIILPHINRSTRRDYESYYNKSTANLVKTAFKEDIDFFGYTYNS